MASQETTPLTGEPLLTGMGHGQNPDGFDVRVLAGRYPQYFDLLSGVTPKPDNSMDAIIVPAARPVEHIEAAASLAKLTGTILIILCSHDATSSGMANKLDDMSVPRWWAVDMPVGYIVPSVELASAGEIPLAARRANPSNLSDKRNVGVALGKMVGLKKILFVDDDVVIQQQALHNASLMLTGHKVAGLRCGGFPDKAVVDHAEEAVVRHHRASTGTTKPVTAGHISGNSVAVDVQRSEIFFPPEIYNEDLFAFYDLYSERSAALVDDYYSQAGFDPFADPARAGAEEFGEILTHGLYQHLQQQSPLELTDRRYWTEVIAHRRWLIGYLLKGLDAPQKSENFTYLSVLPEFRLETKEKIRNSLSASLSVNSAVTGKMCVDYYRSWRADQERWRGYLSRLQDGAVIRDAVDQLQLTSYATNGG